MNSKQNCDWPFEIGLMIAICFVLGVSMFLMNASPKQEAELSQHNAARGRPNSISMQTTGRLGAAVFGFGFVCQVYRLQHLIRARKP
jgi:hypothetical protein